MVRRKLLSAALCCLLAATTTAAWAAGDPAEEEAWKKEPAYGKEIKVGYNGQLCLGTFGVAQAKGFYKAEGLNTKVLRMGAENAKDVVGTGKVDVAGEHIATMLVPTVNGVRVKFTTGIHTGCKSLYVLAASDIKSTKDLVGGSIAIHDGIGASDHNIAMRFLNRDGVDPNQIKWRVAEAGVAVMAMQKGELTAALLGDQFAKQFVDNGTLRIIRSLTFDEDFKHETCCIHVVNLDFAEKNPITVKKLTRAHEAASKWMMENPEEAVKVLQENNWASGDFDLVLEIFKTYDFGVSDEATRETLIKTIDDYKKFGLIDKNKDTGEIMARIWDPVATK